jgi:hypothetical protein
MSAEITNAVLSGLTIVAILCGPVAALHIQRRLDEDREAKRRKLTIFKTLMTFRVARLSPEYVRALNSIDVEFTADNDKEKSVLKAWKELNDLFSNYKTTQNAEEKSHDLNAALLEAMGKSLGYDFDRVYLKKGAYYPEFLVNVEVEQHTLRRLVLELLDGSGKRKLPVAVFEQAFPDVKPLEKP